MPSFFANLHPVASQAGFVATATGVARTCEGYDLPIGINVSGTFVGTLLIEVSHDGTNWAAFGSPVTAPGTVKVDIPVKQVRARCSAYTSGTIVATVGMINSTHYDEV